MRIILLLSCMFVILSCSGLQNNSDRLPQETPDYHISELLFNIKNDPTNPAGYVALGMVYAEMNKYNEALAQYEQALALDPDFHEALFQKGCLMWNQGEKDEGRKIFMSLLNQENTENYAPRIGQNIGHPYVIRQITFGSLANAYPSCSPTHDNLVFQSKRDGNWEIYTMNLHDNSVQRITDDFDRDENPVYSKDGNKIAFTSTRDDTGSSHFEELQRDIYIYDVSKKHLERVVNNPRDDWEPSFSHKGDEIVFCSDRADNRSVPVNERWSNLYLLNLETKETTSLTQGSGNDVSGCFAPDNKLIYFCSNRNGEYDVYSLTLNSMETKQPFSHEGDDVGVRVSADGTKLVFFSKIAENYDIFLHDLQTGKTIRLTNDPAVDGSPDFSADGDHVYFHSNRSGTYQIYAIDLLKPVGQPEVLQALQ